MPAVNRRLGLVDLDSQVQQLQETFPANDHAFGKRYLKQVDGKEEVAYDVIRAPITQEVLRQHITGEQPILVYPMLSDGQSVRFCAFDLDNKPGKAASAYGFSDVIRITDALDSFGLRYLVTRSSGSGEFYGYHIYLLFDGPVAAKKVRAIGYAVLELSGHLHELRHGIRKLCEFFPKQDATDDLGSGIRLPMSLSGIENGRNCIIDKVDSVCPDQWDTLSRAYDNRNLAADVDAIITTHKIPLYSSSTSARRAPGLPKSPSTPRPKATLLPLAWLKRVFDEKSGCEAFVEIKRQIVDGEQIGHHAGFALYWLCLRFKNGTKWFTGRVPGWALTQDDRSQLLQSDVKDYIPMSCAKMQENGLCKKSHPRACMEPTPRDGVYRDPSPFRIARGGKTTNARRSNILRTIEEKK